VPRHLLKTASALFLLECISTQLMQNKRKTIEQILKSKKTFQRNLDIKILIARIDKIRRHTKSTNTEKLLTTKSRFEYYYFWIYSFKINF
jgi:hypothetical protein